MTKYTVQKRYRFDEKTDQMLTHLLKLANQGSRRKVSESAFIRELISQRRQEELGLPKTDILNMQRIMAGCGNNINQIAHRVNSDLFDFHDMVRLRKCMDDINEIRLMLKILMDKLY